MTDFESHVTARVDTAVMLTLTADSSTAGVEAGSQTCSRTSQRRSQ